MPSAPLPADESDRLHALCALKILDTPVEAAFERIVALAARIFDVPIVAVSFIDKERQWLKACYGLDVKQTSRDAAFCAYAILQDEELVVEDAALDPRFADNPLVTGEPGIQFYAGAPLSTADGYHVGVLCLIDTRPRTLDASQRDTLRDLAAMVVRELELRSASDQLLQQTERNRELLNEAQLIFNSVSSIIIKLNEHNIVTHWNLAAERTLGTGARHIVDKPFAECQVKWDLERVQQQIRHSRDTGKVVRLDRMPFFNAAGEQRLLGLTISPIKSDAGLYCGIILLAADTTEREASEQRMRLLEAAVENANDVVLISEAEPVVGTGPRVIYVNPAFERMTGFKAEEIVGKTPRILQGQNTDPKTRAYLRRMLQSWQPAQVELLNYRKDGTEFWVELNIRPLADKTGWHTHWISIQRDVTERKIAEAALRQSETRYQHIVANVPGMVCQYLLQPDESCAFPYVSQRSRDLFGLEPEAVQRDASLVMSRVHPSDFDGLHASISASAASLKPWSWEGRCRHTDGQYRWIAGSGQPQLQPNGDILWDALLIDITARREAETARQESEERLQSALQAGKMSTWDFNLSTGLVTLSLDTQRLLGFEPGEFDGAFASYQQRIHPEDWYIVYTANTQAVEEQRPIDIEFRVILPDGSIRWLTSKGRCFYDEVKQEVRLSGLSSDITERKKAETALLQQAQIFAQVHDAIIQVNLDGVVMFWNRGAERIYGYTSEEAAGKEVAFLYFPEEIAMLYTEILPTLLSTGQYTVELRNRHRSGQEIFVSLSLSLLSDARQVPYGVAILAVDMTERKRIAEELARAVEELETRNWELVEARDMALTATKLKSEFLANTSHEIRTPLNGVLGMIRLLLHTELDTNQRLYAQTVQQSAETLMAIINDILDFSKIEAGKMTIEMVEFSLYDLLEEVASLLAPRAGEKQLEICCDLPPRPLTSRMTAEILEGDPTRLRQIITNLLGNAIKFTQTGEVTVGANLLSESATEARWRLFVRDTGIGIPKESQDLIFESFTQANGSTTRRYGGTGLGLTICRQLATLMNAEIGVESEVGRGSMFWLDITLKKQAYGTDTASSSTTPLVGLCALVGDDNPTQRRILTHLLSSWGMTVIEAEDNCQVETALRQRADAGATFQLLVLDEHLSGRSSTAILQDVRASAAGQQAQVLFLAALGTQQPSAMTQDLRAHYLFKPLRQGELVPYLPHNAALREAGACDSSGEQPQSRRAQGGYRRNASILLAEDNFINQMVIQEWLVWCGFSNEALTIVENGREALTALAEGSYDLVFLDVHMPEIDGLEAACTIRRREQQTGGPRIPIIALTALSESADQQRCLDSGMDDFLVKPVETEQLEACLARWLPALPEQEAPISQAPATPPPTEAQVPTWDRARLAKTSGGNVPLELKLVGEMLNSGPKMLLRCQLAIETEDAPGIEHWSHTLKGSSRTIGLMRLGDLCQQLETCAREGEMTRVEPLYQLLEQEWNVVEESLAAWRSAEG
jgi:two-component system sensor histidine kinase/response regulator